MGGGRSGASCTHRARCNVLLLLWLAAKCCVLLFFPLLEVSTQCTPKFIATRGYRGSWPYIKRVEVTLAKGVGGACLIFVSTKFCTPFDLLPELFWHASSRFSLWLVSICGLLHVRGIWGSSNAYFDLFSSSLPVYFVLGKNSLMNSARYFFFFLIPAWIKHFMKTWWWK